MIAYKQRVMDMDKLTMAHEWYLKHAGGARGHMGLEVTMAWEYADAMQAEADKRDPLSGVKINAYGNVDVAEWQPDWSQAPVGFNSFVVGSNGGHGFFTNIEPKLMGDYYYIGSDGVVFHNHGYTGNWQDSLRKRPQGE